MRCLPVAVAEFLRESGRYFVGCQGMRLWSLVRDFNGTHQAARFCTGCQVLAIRQTINQPCPESIAATRRIDYSPALDTGNVNIA